MTVRHAQALLLLPFFLLPLPPRGAAQVFLSPGLEAAAGHTSNRFLDADEESAEYWRFLPSLEVTVFAPGNVEVLLAGRYSLTDYVRSSLEEVEEVRGEATVTGPLGPATGSVSVRAGHYQDGALPWDDNRWVSVQPVVSWAVASTVTCSLSGSVSVTHYDSRETSDGEAQRDTYWELRPAASWAPARALRLWVEGYGGAYDSNERLDRYQGYGAKLGADVWVLERARVGAWLRRGVREYEDDGEGARRDDPLDAGLWAAFRLAPWAELMASTSWTDARSTDPDNDYRVWTAEAGVRFVYDWEVVSR